MDTIKFLTEVRQSGIKIWVEDGRLQVSAPQGMLTPEIRQEFSKRKSEIIEFLNEASAENIQTPPLEVVSRTNALNLSVSQEALWFLHQTNPGMSAYNMYDAVRLKGPLRVEILERTLQEIVNRHESLRTTFEVIKGQPFQHIAPPGGFVLSKSDLRETPETERETKLCRLVMDEVQKPFDLSEGPLFRAYLFQLSTDHHLVLFTVHHSISDGASIIILRQELSALYSAFSQGKDSPLLDLPVQYADFAAWQRKYLESDDFKDHIAYWKQRLHGIPSALELPTDHARPPIQTFRGETQAFAIPSSLHTGLREIGKNQDSSLFMVLLSTLNILLYRYSGQDDIVVGVPISGRNLPEIQNIQGFFVNVLALRTNLSGKQTFIELLVQLRKDFLEAMSHENVPFEKLVVALQPKRDQSRNPIFQVSFEFEVLTQAFEIPGLEATPYKVGRCAAQFDLAFFLEESETGIRAQVEYNTDLFDSATISRLIGHYLRLLEGIVENPSCSISKLPLLTPVEKKQVLMEWNGTEVEYPKESYVHELFEKQADRFEDSIAVTSGEISLSYGELNRHANQLAHYIKKLGAGPGAFVGICLERSVEMVVGLLAILKSGATYVPLDPMFPKDRLGYMLEASQAPLVITQKNLRKVLPESSALMVYIDQDRELIRKESEDNPKIKAEADRLAYVMFTSGSTGRPKGVQIPHRAVVNFLCSMADKPGITSEDNLLSVTTLSFDISVLEIFLPLSVGARVVVATREQGLDGDKLTKMLKESGITIMQATPATWRILLEAGWKGESQLKILCGGEALNIELANQLAARCESLWNMYGPTETTVWSTIKKIDPETKTIVIGKPIGNTQVYVLDRCLSPVPIGIAGELYIGGDGVALGYLNNPDLTNEKFIPNPFSTEAGSRMYKTGDLARFREDGDLEYLGRNDAQVKIRGFRIELGEIEALLDAHPAVKQSVVVIREDTLGEKRLVAYYVAEVGQDASIGELRLFLKGNLPDYMVPSAFVSLSEFPMTPNRKVDRKSLPEPNQERPELGSEYVAPKTETEKELCHIWSELLKVEKISIHDDFFDLGGHSLMALRVISLINDRFKSDLPPVALFEHPTVAGLCSILNTESQEQATVGAPHREYPTSEKTYLVPKADLALVTETVAKRTMRSSKEKLLRPYRMRESWVCKWLLAPLYNLLQRGSIRRLLQVLILKLEGGEGCTITLRKLYAQHYDIHIGHYSGGFDTSRVKEKTRIGRYTSMHQTVIIQNAEHPKNTISTGAIFYHPALGFTEGYELDRVLVEIGNDVYIGQNAMILYPTKKIGDGAIIAAGSAVIEDVPSYAIVGGYPARVLRYRFSKERIEELLKSKWWEASLEELEPVKDQFMLPVEGEKIR